MLTNIVKTLTVMPCQASDMDRDELARLAKAARLQAGFETESLASQAIGCSRTLVIGWENGSGTIKGSKYQLAAAMAYQVKLAWLTDGLGESGFPVQGDPSDPLVSYQFLPEQSDFQGVRDSDETARSKATLWNVFGKSSYETHPGYVRFAQLEGFAGLGRGDYVGDFPEIVEFVEVTREWAQDSLRGIPLESIRVITGRGDSMRGQYNNGDLIFIDSRIKQFDDDSAYCYRWNGRVQIKRLQLIGNGKVRILSENPKYPPIDVDLREIEIGGRAVAVWTLREF
ncbi:helix-turn-helix transcriptional regulator [Dyella mobilis]|uniref:Helix-turn-helix transcriptional regulator n=1 Tax=Dyella mobilis TaxID=1849582 RepID=A0ABS2KK92_9GAMM|nr:helix-turn-helix transcriptional regulator [Dyella mobilis]MBM7131586.1 helix-turn-helix transcriptional regulator [Dyella mobilis]GLQ96440.1 hypothetical protein GCM10007863_08580 [Dyella mobilis]